MPKEQLDKYITLIRNQSESEKIAFDVLKLQFKKPTKKTPVLVIGGEADVSFKKSIFRI